VPGHPSVGHVSLKLELSSASLLYTDQSAKWTFFKNQDHINGALCVRSYVREYAEAYRAVLAHN
jgi:hypothetical protein